MNIKKLLTIIATLVVIIFLGRLMVVKFFDSQISFVPAPSVPTGEVLIPAIPEVNPSSVSISDPYEGWKTYTNDVYNFSMRYPSNWTAVEDPEGTTGAAGGGFVKFFPSRYLPDGYSPENIRVRLESQGPNTEAARYGIESLQELRQRDILAGLEGKHPEYRDYIMANYKSAIEDLGGFRTLIISLGPKYGIHEMDFTIEESTYVIFDNYQTSNALSQELTLHDKILHSLKQI